MVEVPAIFGNDLQADLAQWSFFVSHEISEGWHIFPAEKILANYKLSTIKQSNMFEGVWSANCVPLLQAILLSLSLY